MTQAELANEYFEWMYTLVCEDHYSRLSYRKLLYLLHTTEFYYLIGMDGNREEDGLNLRYRFGFECDINEAVVSSYLDDCPCSVLEMMIALSIRIEEHIMDDPDVGNRTGQWFWGMIVNLGLGSMSDERFDREAATDILERFLNREYGRNGEGGLFTVHNCRYDLRSVDIWYQAMWYLSEEFKTE